LLSTPRSTAETGGHDEFIPVSDLVDFSGDDGFYPAWPALVGCGVDFLERVKNMPPVDIERRAVEVVGCGV
jgi:hypothetical protein